jgi:hypothetical protein
MPTRSSAIPAFFIVLAIAAFCIATYSEENRIRVFVADSHSWSIGGGAGVSSGSGGVSLSGGARPQTAEIMKTFGERCTAVTVTMKQDSADYVVILDHEGGKEPLLHDNKVAVFNRDGDMIYSGSTRVLGNAVKNACVAITKDLGKNP